MKFRERQKLVDDAKRSFFQDVQPEEVKSLYQKINGNLMAAEIAPVTRQEANNYTLGQYRSGHCVNIGIQNKIKIHKMFKKCYKGTHTQAAI